MPRFAAVGVLVVVVLCPAFCRAAPSEAEMAEAKRHYKRAAAAYDKNDFPTALREFTRVYELSQKPDILFNLARVETKLGHDQEAIKHLERYLEIKPDAEDARAVRAEIEARRTVLKAKQDEEAARRKEQAARDEAASARREEEAARSRADDATRFVPQARAGIALVTIGGALLLTGIALGVVALQATSSVERGAGMPVPFAGSSFAADESLGRAVTPVGLALDAVGAAALVTGVSLLVWRRVASDRAPRAWLVPAPGGFAVAGVF